MLQKQIPDIFWGTSVITWLRKAQSLIIETNTSSVYDHRSNADPGTLSEGCCMATHLREYKALQNLLLERTWQKRAPQFHELQHGLRVTWLPVISHHPAELGHDYSRAELHIRITAASCDSLKHGISLLLLRF